MNSRGRKVAVVGAGVYGSTIALRLSQDGFCPIIFDPLGVLNAASCINQLRVHRGYHYPRSPETITETQEAVGQFLAEYGEALVGNIDCYYSIPFAGSFTSSEKFELVCQKYCLSAQPVTPSWIDFNFIDKCYLVDEFLYDPSLLRKIVCKRLSVAGIPIVEKIFNSNLRDKFDHVVYATYGSPGSRELLFDRVKLQVAEKVLVRLPSELKGKSLVVIDGPFTAFDPYGNTGLFQFGSAKYTNHWSTCDQTELIPSKYKNILYGKRFEKVDFTKFDLMRNEASHAVPLASKAEYVGSKFTLRLTEDAPDTDRRILRVVEGAKGDIHVFSGKVVSAVKAAKIVSDTLLIREL
jgi:hypothetical protein